MNYLIKDKSFYRHILYLMLPLLIQQLLRISVDTFNSVMLGNINQVEMSAVMQADQVFFVYYTLVNGIATGCCILVSQYWGKNNKVAIKKIMAIGLKASFCLSLFFGLCVCLCPTFFINIYSNDPDIVYLGAKYLRLTSLMYLPCGLSVMIFALCRGVEQVKIILVTNIFSYALNILLNYLLVFGKWGLPALGIKGVALGLICSRIVEFLICSSYFYHFSGHFKFSDLKFFDKDLAYDCFKVALPIVAHELVWSLGTSSGNMLMGRMGKDVIAGYNVTVVFYNLLATIGNSYLTSCNVLISSSLGRGNIAKVKSEAKTMLSVGLFIGCTLGLVTYFGRSPFLNLYALSPLANYYAKNFMLVIAIIWPFSAIEMTGMIALLRAAGEGYIGFITDIIAMWCISIPLATYALNVLHLDALYIIIIIKMVIICEALVGLKRVLSFKWIKNLTRANKF